MNPEEIKIGIEAGGVIAPYIVNLITKLWNGAKESVKTTTYKSMIDLGMVFKEYLEFTCSRNEKIKTFIYSNESRPIYSLYVHIDLMVNERRISTEDINNLLDIGNYIVISGTGGSGKSTLLKHLFLNCVTETELIPVLIDLRSLNNLDIKNESMEDVVYEILQDHHFKLEKEYFVYSIQQGCFLFIFDGYDELNKDKIDIVGDKIKRMGTKYNDNYYIVSSREDDRFAGWNEYIQADMLPMKKSQAIRLIQKLEFDEEKKQLFIDELNTRLYEQHKSFASNPLLLSIMLLTYKENMEIPDNLSEFYEQAYTAMYSRHDALKDLKREKNSGLSQLEFKDVFAHFCFKSFMNEEYEFTENQILTYLNNARKNNIIDRNFVEQDYLEDMIRAVCLIVKDGLKYKYSHRSFQEYFAAYFTCKLEDKYQKIILRNYMEKAKTTNSYILMVRDMQKKKFESLIVVPIGKEIIEMLENKGWCSVVENIYFHIMFDETGDGTKNFFTCTGVGGRRKKYYGFITDIIKLYCPTYYDQQRKMVYRDKLIDYYQEHPEYLNKRDEVEFSTMNSEILQTYIMYENLEEVINCLREIIEKYDNGAYKGTNVQDLLDSI